MTKYYSKLLYGIAILLMMFLRVAAGNMFSVKSLFLPDKALTLVAIFGKICVSIYAFISGFGLWKTYEKLEDKSIQNLSVVIIKRLVKFWKVYWPICIMVAIEKVIFDPFEFVKNMIGLSTSYNPACWYVVY